MSNKISLQRSLGRKTRGTDIDVPPSTSRLDQLGFDPMENMVHLYRRLEEEDRFWQEIRRRGKVTFMDTVPTGIKQKTIRYSALAHMSVFNNMEKINNSLLRYKYARVPEPRELTPPVAGKGGLDVYLTDDDSDDIIEGEITEEFEEGYSDESS